MVNGPSAHLTWQELACRDAARTPYPAEWRTTRAVTLGIVFEQIRAACGGKAITVTSGYRTPAYNRAVDGKLHSQHVAGRAMDLKPPVGWTVPRFHAMIARLSAEPGSAIGGIGLYRTFVHVDVRPRITGRVARWAVAGSGGEAAGGG